MRGEKAMANEIVTRQQLVDAGLDAESLQKFISGLDSEDVLTRFGQKYPTLAKLVRILMETGGWKAYQTEAELLATTPMVNPSVGYAFDTKKMYLWNGTSWVNEGLSQLDQAKLLLEGRISSTSGKVNQAFISAASGEMIAGFEKEQASFANIDILKSDIPGIPLLFIGEDGFTLVPLREPPGDAPTSSGGAVQIFDLAMPSMSNLLVGWLDKPIQLYVPQLFNERAAISTAKTVKASFISKTEAYTKQDNQLLEIDLSKVGSAAQIMFRNDSNFGLRTLIDMNVKGIGAGTSAVKILMIGDSIIWNDGSDIVKQALEDHGYSPTFIGTLFAPISLNDQPHEGHSGWETGDFTNLIHDRSAPIPVGDEAKYMAGTAPYAAKNEFNPFIRLATGSDDPSVIRDGYVFDAVFYRDRFGFGADVDCIFIGTGTNDLRDRPDSTLTSIYNSEINLMINSLKVAFPNAAIVLCTPNTANTTSRNNLWSKYYRLHREAMSIAKARSAERVYFAPIHAMTCPEIGYLTTGSVDTNSGAITGTFNDDIHPYHGSRIQTWYNAAAYVAAAKNGAI